MHIAVPAPAPRETCGQGSGTRWLCVTSYADWLQITARQGLQPKVSIPLWTLPE